MDERNIKEILQITLKNLSNKKFVWRLEGSANLKIQGIDVSVKDLDITTNNEGIEIFRNALKKFIIKDFFSSKINGHSLICNINDFEIEINSYRDRKLNMFDKAKNILWNDLQISILQLEYVKVFYKSINRKEKIDLITKHLNQHHP